MKNIIISSILFLLTTTTANSQLADLSSKVLCTNAQNVKEYLLETEQELLFVGSSHISISVIEENQYVDFFPISSLWVNQDEGIWSLIAQIADNSFCIVLAGNDFMPYSGPTLRQLDSIND